jgi:hypothetical protein
MKKILSFVMGIGLFLSLGMAYAEEGTGGVTYPGEKMIRDDDLEHLNLDQDRATVNQVPALPEIEGSAPGGVREEPKDTDTDIEQSKEPVGIVPAAPEEEGIGKGEEGKEPERSRY